MIRSFFLLWGFIGLMWLVEVVNFLTDHRLNSLGLLPREASGLLGILVSPMLHGGLGHIALNTPPLIILGGFVAVEGSRMLLQVTGIVIVGGGAALWLLGRFSYHIGASGLVFGYFGYLLGRAWYDRGFCAVAVAVVTFAVYGGMLWGVLPNQPNVSWEGHLFGFGAGIVAANLTRKRSPR